MQPAPGKYANANLLSRIVALVRVVCYEDVKSSVSTFVIVATGAPMLPFSSLLATSFLPHALRVIKALGSHAIRLQSEILFRF